MARQDGVECFAFRSRDLYAAASVFIYSFMELMACLIACQPST